MSCSSGEPVNAAPTATQVPKKQDSSSNDKATEIAPEVTAEPWVPDKSAYLMLDAACGTELASSATLTSGSANALFAAMASTSRAGFECVLATTGSPLTWADFEAGVSSPRMWDAADGTWASSGSVIPLGEDQSIIVNFYFVGLA